MVVGKGAEGREARVREAERYLLRLSSSTLIDALSASICALRIAVSPSIRACVDERHWLDMRTRRHVT